MRDEDVDRLVEAIVSVADSIRCADDNLTRTIREGITIMSVQSDALTAALVNLKTSLDANDTTDQAILAAITASNVATTKFEADVVTLLQQIAAGGPVDLTPQIAAVQAAQAQADTARQGLASAAANLGTGTTAVGTADTSVEGQIQPPAPPPGQ